MNNSKTRKRILIVDDEPGIGKVLRINLRLSGYDVISTTSGAEAIELVRTRKLDIVLLDVLMPDVTGMDVLERIRTFSQVPIIIFTVNPEIAREVLKMGANDYIGKPLNLVLLADKIKLVLSPDQHIKGHDAKKEENPSRR
jgi:DNA-binding response OmpR family regulator